MPEKTPDLEVSPSLVEILPGINQKFLCTESVVVHHTKPLHDIFAMICARSDVTCMMLIR